MTIGEKTDKLHQLFTNAWENYKKVETKYSTVTGFMQLLSTPELKSAYQKWQSDVSNYYDFARSVEGKDLSEEVTGN